VHFAKKYCKVLLKMHKECSNKKANTQTYHFDHSIQDGVKVLGPFQYRETFQSFPENKEELQKHLALDTEVWYFPFPCRFYSILKSSAFTPV